MKSQLSRSLGFFEFLCLGINCVVGTGVFLLPSLVFAKVGPSGALAYLLCGALCLLIGLCFCEMAGRFEGTGARLSLCPVHLRSFYRISRGVADMALIACGVGFRGQGILYLLAGADPFFLQRPGAVCNLHTDTDLEPAELPGACARGVRQTSFLH